MTSNVNRFTDLGKPVSTRCKAVLLSLSMSMLALGSTVAFAEEDPKLAGLALQKVTLSDLSNIKSVKSIGKILWRILPKNKNFRAG